MGKISHPHGMSSRADVSAKQEGCDNTHDEQWWRMEKTKNRRDCSVIDASSSLCVSFSLSPPCRRHNQPENSSESGCCCLACFYFVVRCDNCISDQRDSSTEKTWNDVNISIFYDKYFVTHLGYVMVHWGNAQYRWNATIISVLRYMYTVYFCGTPRPRDGSWSG